MWRCGILAIVVLLVPGCFIFPWLIPDGSGGDATGSPELKQFESEQELGEYLTGQIKARNSQVDDLSRAQGDSDDAVEALDAPNADTGAVDGAGGEAAPTADAESSDESYSQTTTQEVGVDEADVVKTDGSYIYTIQDEILRIVQVDPREALSVVAEEEVEGYGRELYLYDGKVVVITDTGGYFHYVGSVSNATEPAVVDTEVVEDPAVGDSGEGSATSGDDGDADDDDADADEGDSPASGDDGDADDDQDGDEEDDAEDREDDPKPDEETPDGAEPAVDPYFDDYVYERPQTVVTIYDVSVPSSPVRLSQISFDGTQSSSRMIDGVLHLVLANYQSYYYDVLPRLGSEELDVTDIEVEEAASGVFQDRRRRR